MTSRSRRHFGTLAKKAHRFTLVELMVGMAILTILMLMMFQFLLSAQKALELSDSVWKIYDNSRVVFDLVERDLQASALSVIPGKEIGIYVGEPEATDHLRERSRHLVFVSSTEPPEADGMTPTSRLCEVTYMHHLDSVTASPDIPPYTLTRQIVSDVDTDNWDFLGIPTDWYKNGSAKLGTGKFNDEAVCGGIGFFEIAAYDANDAQNRDETHTTMPNRVVITLELFDEALTDAPEDVRNRTSRAFTKIFFLTHLETN